MGLDISYYKEVKKIPRLEDVEEHYDNGDVVIDEQDFKLQLGSLKENDVYSSNKTGKFCPGSYGGYNSWRRGLFNLVNKDITIEVYWKETSYLIDEEFNGKNETKPFMELINFSDCEGNIGPEICKKLYIDFDEYKDLARERMDSYSYQIYEKFMTALEGDNTIVSFH